LGYPYVAGHSGYLLFYDCNIRGPKCNIWSNVFTRFRFGGLYLCNVFVMELVLCFSVIYIVSYGSMLVVWCVLGMYLVSLGRLFMVLMGIIFYRGLIVVTMLMVIPNGNAHYYYNSLVLRLAVVNCVGSIYLGLLVVVILVLVIIF